MCKLPLASFLFTLGLSAALSSVTGCSGPQIDLDAWRAKASIARAEQARGELEADLARVESARNADDLPAARGLALALAAERPDDARVLMVASRGESDGLFLIDESDKSSRNHAASSALDYAERAVKLGATDAASRAQLAWALGTTTHLQPMFDRSAHARRTLATAQEALNAESNEPTALATLAIVNLRLETLPWIASVMAVGRPDSSLADAEAFARRAVEARPSRENRLILAKVLVAADRDDDARRELEIALSGPVQFPRDTALEPSVRALLAEVNE